VDGVIATTRGEQRLYTRVGIGKHIGDAVSVEVYLEHCRRHFTNFLGPH
jgi:hypothetical protein